MGLWRVECMELVGSDGVGAEVPRKETVEELFRALESLLLAYALRFTRDRAVAEELVQESFLKLHSHYDSVLEPRRWLYRTVHNLALNHQRSAHRQVPLQGGGGAGGSEGEGSASAAGPELSDPRPLPDEQIARWEGIGLVRLSLGTLDERSRQLVQLKFHEDLSYKEISARTGLTVGHVGYLLHHALKAMAVELARIGVVK